MSYLQLVLDPGLYKSGMAVWDSSNWNKKPVRPPGFTALWRTKAKQLHWVERARLQGGNLNQYLEDYNVRKIYCEWPDFQGYDAQKESIFKLAALVGTFNGIALMQNVSFEVVPVRFWKGQLPKKVVIRRVKSILGEKNCEEFSDDIWDAVGVGLFLQGAL